MLAGVLAGVPDWDGLTLVCGMQVFDRGTVPGGTVCLSARRSASLSTADFRFDLAGHLRRWLAPFTADPPAALRRVGERSSRDMRSGWRWTADVLESSPGRPGCLRRDAVNGLGAETLLAVLLAGFYSIPRPWGDPGVSVILVAGMFAMWRWRHRLQSVATTTIVSDCLLSRPRGLCAGFC